MSHKQAVQLRAKILGVLLRDARLAASKSMKELGEALGISSGSIRSIERGLRPPSLPELEILAYYLGVPIDHFWREEIVSEEPHPIDTLNIATLLALRDRTIGAQIRQARNERGLSQKELAKQTDISTGRISRYENGESPAPLPELEQIANALGLGIQEFTTSSGLVGDWIASRRAIESFLKLPKSLQELITKPGNRYYLEMAQRFSNIPPEKLRALAEGLLDISTETQNA